MAIACSCGGSTVGDGDRPDGGTTGGSGGSGATGSGTGGSGAGGSSAGGSSAGGSGGLTSSPGTVDCDGTDCVTPSDYCCIEDPGAQLIYECFPRTGGPPCGGVYRECDEAADCAAGEKCCVPMTARPFPAYRTECAPECDEPYYWFQVCSSSAECSGAESCVLQLCEGQPLQSCGPVDTGFCRP